MARLQKYSPEIWSIIDCAKRIAAAGSEVAQLSIGKSTQPRSVFAAEFALYVICLRFPTCDWCRGFSQQLGSLCEMIPLAEGLFCCLYSDPLISIDLHFLSQSHTRIAESAPETIWERHCPPSPSKQDGTSSIPTRNPVVLAGSPVESSAALCLLNIYTAIAKLHRGELFEAVNKLASVRSFLAFLIAGLHEKRMGSGLRNFEKRYPDWILQMGQSVPESYAAAAVSKAILASLSTLETLEQKFESLKALNYKEARNSLVSFLANGELHIRNAEPKPRADSLYEHREHGVPPHMCRFLHAAVGVMKGHADICGVALGGSWLGRCPTSEVWDLDAYSDLDIYVVVGEQGFRDPTSCLGIAQELAPAFVLIEAKDRHVIALYSTPLLRVDLWFKTLDELQRRWETPSIQWERGDAIKKMFLSTRTDPSLNRSPQPTIHWLESNFWLAVLNCVTQLGHGQLFQVISHLNSLRVSILGPMIAIARGVPCRGVRLLEFRFPDLANKLEESVARYGPIHCWEALGCLLETYRHLRTLLPQSGLRPSPAEPAIWNCFMNSRPSP